MYGELAGCRVLIAEDEYVLAADTARLLRQAGATIVGPIGTLEEAREREAEDGFDAAVLDIRLDRDLIYPVADLIQAAGIPMTFLTGYDEVAVPDRFAGIALCQKPCPDEALIDLVRKMCPR